jgi:beta-1,4-N-acetylglucosaminyltransferase
MLYAATAAGALVLLALLLRRRRKRDEKIKTLVVLGSGGHTAELLRLIADFDFDRYGPLTLVTAATDTTSRAKAERELPQAALSTARWAAIPRAREVGQSFLSSVPSTLKALFACVRLIWTASPDLVLVNGPGTCVPVAVLGRLFGSRVIFVESWCRVESLSLTGRIMYWVAHRFVVHWPELVRRYPRAEYLGRIC